MEFEARLRSVMDDEYGLQYLTVPITAESDTDAWFQAVEIARKLVVYQVESVKPASSPDDPTPTGTL